MTYYEIAPLKIARAGHDVFTYASEAPLMPGYIVTIELGKKETTGVVIRRVDEPTYTTKEIIKLVEQTPIPAHLVKTALWMRDYYRTPLATVLTTILPRGLTKTRRTRIKSPHISSRKRTHFLLNSHQENAVKTIEEMSPGSAILHGVTGSGKTRVYIELAEKALARGQSVIMLVPEIALTSQLVDEFSHHFEDIILTHSRQTEAERHIAWRDALTSEAPRVAIGPRSALFLPLASLGLIIIDESHEPSFKQEQSPRYTTSWVASYMMRTAGGHVILGSATPLVTDYYLAEHTGRPIISLPERATADVLAPTTTVIDATKRDSFHKHRFLSDKLITEIEHTLANGKQSLLFHNRRGTASTTLCDQCGWTALCSRCFVPYTLHADRHALTCHICGKHEPVPTSCPVCHNASIIHKGIGTKLLETELQKLFPHAHIARFDADTATTGSVDQRYKELYDGDIDIIIGTQVIAKGLDLPHLRTVGVVQADAGLSLPDYTSGERTFQLLAQVVGRVGRTKHLTSVIVQSYQPQHPSVVDGITQNYAHFYQETLATRKRALFPPFRYLLRLTCVYKTEAAAIRNAQLLARTLRQVAPQTVDILGPTPAFYERQHDTYRWQLVLKSARRTELVQLLEHIPPTHWQAELDPLSLL